MRRQPTKIHQNDEPILRDMLDVQRPYPLPECSLRIYQRVADYATAITTATLSNVPGALLLVAYQIEEIEAKRFKCEPHEVAARYNAEQKAAFDLAAEERARKADPKKQLAGAK